MEENTYGGFYGVKTEAQSNKISAVGWILRGLLLAILVCLLGIYSFLF